MLPGRGDGFLPPETLLGWGHRPQCFALGRENTSLPPETLLGWGCCPQRFAVQAPHGSPYFPPPHPPVPREELLLEWDFFIRSLPLFSELRVVILTPLSSTD